MITILISKYRKSQVSCLLFITICSVYGRVTTPLSTSKPHVPNYRCPKHQDHPYPAGSRHYKKWEILHGMRTGTFTEVAASMHWTSRLITLAADCRSLCFPLTRHIPLGRFEKHRCTIFKHTWLMEIAKTCNGSITPFSTSS